MKESFDQIIITEITSNVIYKIKAEFFENEDGTLDVDASLEPIKTDTIPNDSYSYFVPIRLTNQLNETRLALANCNPKIQFFCEPFYIIGDDSRLINVRDAGFLSGETYSLQSLQDLEGFDDSLEEASRQLPNDVAWENFLPRAVIPGVGYAFIPGQINLEAFENLPEDASDDQVDEASMNTQILHKVQMKRLPVNMFVYYIPVRVSINETQTRDGYAYYDASEHEVVDIHFFDERWGQVSVVHTPEKVEDMGFIINREVLSYEFLLPEVEPIRHRFELE